MGKWVGAVLVVAGCGGWGILIAAACRRQEQLLASLYDLLQLMQWELKYRLTALPELCRMAARDTAGPLKGVFLELAGELEKGTQPDAAGCMAQVLEHRDSLPPRVKRILRSLGRSLGRFDLDGQIREMECVAAQCQKELQGLERDRDIKLRSYRTLGFCAGGALVILLL